MAGLCLFAALVLVAASTTGAIAPVLNQTAIADSCVVNYNTPLLANKPVPVKYLDPSCGHAAASTSAPYQAPACQTNPPTEEGAKCELQRVASGVDDAVFALDPTNGTIPAVNAIRMQGTTNALGEKLDAYKQMFENGLLPQVPFSEVALEDIGFQEGFLPNRTLSQGLGLLANLGVETFLAEPVACAKSSPRQAVPGSTFTLDASCSTDVETATRDLEVRWDWTNDGSWDTAWSFSKAATHVFSATGTQPVGVQARDPEGNIGAGMTEVWVSAPPTACFTTPAQRPAWEYFELDASCSTDDFTTTPNLQVRWDWTSDGAWDTSWTTSKTAYVYYGSTGDWTITLQAKDYTGLTGTASRTVTVTPGSAGGGGGGASGCTGQANAKGAVNEPASVEANTEDQAKTSGSGGPVVKYCGVSPGNTATNSASIGLPIDASGEIDGALEATESVPLTTLIGAPPPVIFQHNDGTYHSAGDGEVLYWEGERLRFNPIEVPMIAFVSESWLVTAFGTYGSTTQFEFAYLDGARYAGVNDPSILAGDIDAFSAVVLGQTDLYTVGHRDMVFVDQRAMEIKFLEYPGWVDSTSVRGGLNDTTQNATRYRWDRLAIDFNGDLRQGQTVFVDKAWLEGLLIDSPRFTHADGSSVVFETEPTHYVLHPEHFSGIYVEDFNDGVAGGWSLTGLWHISSACGSTYSGNYMAFNKDSTCDYNTGETVSGSASFDLNLAAASSPTLTFVHRYTVESYSTPYDLMKVQVSTDGGSNWQTLKNWDSTMASQPSWNSQSVSLSTFTGLTVKVRFSFESLDNQYNNFAGWFIDNVQVTGTGGGNSPPTAAFSISPSTGSTSQTFTVDAGGPSGSNDAETSQASLQVRWDWTNDGTYDTTWEYAKTATHSYSWAGTYTIRLQVRDQDLATGTTTKFLTVNSPGTGGTITIRDDDGGMEASYDFDASDDSATKRLILPGDARLDASSATLWMYAKSNFCGSTGNSHTLKVNSYNSASFNPCNVWSSSVFEWKTFTIPLSQLQDGSTNSFQVLDTGSSYNERDIYFAMDQGVDYGRSDASANNVDVGGELMWYLVIQKGGSSNTPPTASFTASPSSGSTSTVFTVDASGSSDPETTPANLEVKWDWENDGIWDTPFTKTKTATHNYASSGTFTIALMVRDGAGSPGTSSQIVTVSGGPPQSGFGAAFESGNSGWTFTGLWHISGCRYYTGTQGLAYNQGSCDGPPNYNVGTTSGTATTPSFVVPSWSPVLSLKSWYETEGGTSWDKKIVEISSDNGASWKQLQQIGGNMRDWRVLVIPLDQVAGQTVKLRFTFNSVDPELNSYQGWVLDDIQVKADENSVLHTSEWIHSTVQANGFQSFDRHDAQADLAWYMNDASDSMSQTLNLDSDPGNAGKATLWVAGMSQGCSSSNGLSHELRLNGQQVWQFSACVWSSSEYQWVGFELPAHLLNAGSNTFQLRGICSCGQTLLAVTDDDSGGTYTTLVINGQTQAGNEAFWYLYLSRPTTYETLEHYTTLEYKDGNGVRHFEHSQEAFVYYNPDTLDTLYLMRREMPDGKPSFVTANLQFEKRVEYAYNQRIQGLDHYVLDSEQALASNQGKKAPTNGQFYTWFKTQWESLAPGDDGNYVRKQGKFMQLVPSNPNDSTDRGFGMNPSASGSDSDDTNGFDWKLGLEGYVKTCAEGSHKHFPWDSAQHPHDCWRFGLTLFDMDQKYKDWAKAADASKTLVDWWMAGIQTLTMAEWLTKFMRITVAGFIVSWLFSIAQTGDLFSLGQEEFDRKTLGIWVGWTVTKTVPPIPGWIFAFDPQQPVHTLIWNGAFDASFSTPNWP